VGDPGAAADQEAALVTNGLLRRPAGAEPLVDAFGGGEQPPAYCHLRIDDIVEVLRDVSGLSSSTGPGGGGSEVRKASA